MAPRSPIPPTGVARPGCPRPRRLRVALVAAVVLGAGLGTVQQAATPRPAGAAATSWPLHWSVDTPGWNRSSSPVIADIDGDGANEVVVGHQDGILRAYEGDGSLRWATAAVPGIGAGCRAQSGPTAVDSSPAVADLDGDGTAEVIVGLGSTWRSGQNGSLLVLDGPSGAIEWRWAGGRDRDTIPANTGVPDGWCDGVFTTPAVADVDGDGSLDIVFAGWDFNIWAVDHTGTALAGFPFDNDDTVWSSPAVFDIDGDGDAEILIGGDSTPGGYLDHRGGVFRALDNRGGTVVELWRALTNEVLHSSPAVGDVDGDGRVEVVVGSGEVWGGSDRVRLWAWHVDDGTTVPGFPVAAGGTILASPALGDIDGDGAPEIVVGSFDHKVYAWNGDGTLQWSVTPTFAHLGTGRITGHAVIADLDGDGDQDVAVGTALGVALLDGRTGAQLDDGLDWWNRVDFARSHESAPAVGVLDGQRRIIVSGFDTPAVSSRLVSHTLPATSATDAWPMFRHGADRTGSAFAGLCDVVTTAGQFCDVPDGAYYSAAVRWMVDQGITTGLTPTRFGPDVPLDRGQMITLLWRQAGQPVTASTLASTGFVDVTPWDFFADAVVWAKNTRVTTGTSTTTFSPFEIVSRAQLVTFLWRSVGSPTGYPAPGFVDVPAAEYYARAVAWAKAVGVTTGTSITTFSPTDPVTRGQAAALMYRLAVAA